VKGWDELTRDAQAALWLEAQRLLAQAPNQAVVPLLRAEMERHPETIPSWVRAARKATETVAKEEHDAR
jgi:hypothetical protein